jgi:hypothetical protein
MPQAGGEQALEEEQAATGPNVGARPLLLAGAAPKFHGAATMASTSMHEVGGALNDLVGNGQGFAGASKDDGDTGGTWTVEREIFAAGNSRRTLSSA